MEEILLLSHFQMLKLVEVEVEQVQLEEMEHLEVLLEPVEMVALLIIIL